MMRRVTTIKSSGQWNPASAIDRVVLDAGDRNRRRIVLTAEKGTELLLDFAKPVSLRDGDGLLLDDGSIVLVTGQPEPLIEVSAGSAGTGGTRTYHTQTTGRHPDDRSLALSAGNHKIRQITATFLSTRRARAWLRDGWTYLGQRA